MYMYYIHMHMIHIGIYIHIPVDTHAHMATYTTRTKTRLAMCAPFEKEWSGNPAARPDCQGAKIPQTNQPLLTYTTRELSDSGCS